MSTSSGRVVALALIAIGGAATLLVMRMSPRAADHARLTWIAAAPQLRPVGFGAPRRRHLAGRAMDCVCRGPLPPRRPRRWRSEPRVAARRGADSHAGVA